MPETRAAFHERVADLEQAITAIGREVGETIPDAADAWLRRDAARGREIASRRDVWTERSKLVEQGAYELIATQQPMAGDLRRLVSLIRLSEEVSRSGALVAHVARAAAFEREPGDFSDSARRDVAAMARIGSELWREALDAYASGDAVSAARVATADDRLDSLHRSLIDGLVSAPTTAGAVDVALLGRYLERLGDHAVDIAARAGFVVTGEMP
jgi:phosphate transport system protein